MVSLNEIWNQVVYGNSLKVWTGALAIAILSGVLLRALIAVARSQLKRRAERAELKTEAYWERLMAGLVNQTKFFAPVVAAVFVGSRFVDMSAPVRNFLDHAVVIAVIVQAGFWVGKAVEIFLEGYRERCQKENPSAATTLRVISFLARVGVWTIVLLLILANAEIKIGPLLAGLGVGGIAVALAVQTVLKDLLASLSIILDKPFMVGDFLIIGDFMGSVEKIGLKTTRFKSISGEQIIFSNDDLLGSRIRNYGRMKERRVVFSIGVTYQTPREKLQKVPGIIKAAIEEQEKTRFDRSHFKAYGDFALLFETVYFMNVPDYAAYMDTQQAVNFRIHEAFEKEGIEFAYPTQTLFLERAGKTEEGS